MKLKIAIKKSLFLLVLFSLSFVVNAQRLHFGVFTGLAAYNGDLTEKFFPKKVTNGAIGITGNYELTDKIMLRAGITYSVVGGADRFNKDIDLQSRNLSFETKILEFSAIGEYYLQNLNEVRYSPYFFGGLAVFHFNPYAYTATKQQVFLQPLSTEGQGILGYPGKPYKLTQFAIPLGAGVKFAVTSKVRVGLELGLRYLFTDYLDDVSTNYADPNDLLAAKGQTAVDFAFRGDEINGSSYPAKGSQRGSPKVKDYYYNAGIHLTYRLGEGSRGFGRRSGTGCPTNVY